MYRLVRAISYALVAQLFLPGCLGVAVEHGRDGDFAGQEILEIQFGVATGASVGERDARSALSMRLGGGADFTIDGLGFGMRANLIANSTDEGDEKMSFGGLGLSAHAVLGGGDGWVYSGVGYIIGLDNAALQIEGETRDSDGLYAYLGGRARIWEITDRMSYILVIEIGPTWSFATDLGAYSSFDIRFGSILTF